MNLWYKKSIVFVLAGISYAVGQYLRGEWFQHIFFSICRYSVDSWGVFCNSPYLTQGFTLILLGQTLAIVALLLLFANTQTFHKWWRFSYWYLPIATLLTFSMYPTTTLLGGVVPITQGVRLFGEPYVIITAYIVARYVLSFAKQKLCDLWGRRKGMRSQ